MKKQRNKSKTVRMTLSEARKHKKLQTGEKSLKELAVLKDSEIDYSDIPELSKEFWKNAQLLRPTHKTMMSLRLDDEVVEWFKNLGKGYQSHMNTVLRAYVEAQKSHRDDLH